MIRYNGKEVILKYNGSNCVKMMQNGVTLWEEVVKSYIVSGNARYSGSTFTITVNGKSVSCTDEKDKDLSSYAPITTFKMNNDGIIKLPYLGDCTEVNLGGSHSSYRSYIPDVNTKKCTKITLSNFYAAYGIDLDSVTYLSLPTPSVNGSTGVYDWILVRNLGKSSLTTYNFSGASDWNTSTYKHYLIASLITNSYDRAANGMDTATITLDWSTLNGLSSTEKAQITSKGFTLAGA